MFVGLVFSSLFVLHRRVTSILTRGDAGTEGDHRTCPSQEAPAAEMSPRAQQSTHEVSLWEFFYFFPSKEVFSPVSADSLEV